jgi:glycine hydroxymethyltransferase
MNFMKKKSFFTGNLSIQDPEIFDSLDKELTRQKNEIELIASENIASKAVMEAQGSVMTNKYAEGYVGKRYYGGCENVDVAEQLAISRVCELYDCNYANVQPNSGSQANQAVFFALMKPGDTFLSMDLSSGGHLTHGAKPNQSGRWFNPIHYGVSKETNLLDYGQVEELAKEHRPKIIIAGGSAVPRQIDFKIFREICDSVGAYLLVDMAHISGLVAARVHPNPLYYADVVTSTTHKTLRGPRGGMILCNNLDIAKKVNSAIFPGIQGGPLMHIIAAKAVAFREALTDDFVEYQEQVIKNAKHLAVVLKKGGIDIITDGTDTHVLLVDLRKKGVTGVDAEKALAEGNIVCNKNSIPFDIEKPMITSGIRLGTPATTTRGFREREFDLIGGWIVEIVDSVIDGSQEATCARIRKEVVSLCNNFPIY